MGDSSLSMSDMGDGPIDGSKNFMKQYKDLGDKYDDKTINVTFISFSDDAKWVYNGPAHKITNYIEDICSDFHSFWNKGKDDETLRIIDEKNFEKTLTKLIWIDSFRIILKRAFDIISIDSPENM